MRVNVTIAAMVEAKRGNKRAKAPHFGSQPIQMLESHYLKLSIIYITWSSLTLVDVSTASGAEFFYKMWRDGSRYLCKVKCVPLVSRATPADPYCEECDLAR